MTITLIATGHKQHGLCNPDQLYQIIKQVDPDIIFEEIPPGRFAAVYGGSTRDSLETFTIKTYLQKHSTAHFPVDLDIEETAGKHYRNGIREMFYLFNEHSEEYSYLLNQNGLLAERFGFPYLNSDECTKLLQRRHSLEKQIVQSINDGKLNQTYNGWLNFVDSRRNEMVKNIYSYCELNKYERGLFLIGAEHRQPIIDKLVTFEKNMEWKLDWDFNYFR